MSKLPSVLNAGRVRWTLALVSTAGAVALAAAAIPAAAAATSSPAAGPAAPAAAHVVHASTTVRSLHPVGHVNLASLAKRYANLPNSATHATRHTAAPLRTLHAAGTASAAASTPAAATARSALNRGRMTKIKNRNLAGEHGFVGLTAPENAAVNTIVGDVSPPDQGLAVGPLRGRHGSKAVVEFVNDALNVYSPKGNTILGAIPASAVLGLPAYTFLSDPRAYYDNASGHWFFTMFDIAGLGVPGYPVPSSSEQYIAVSTSTNLLGNYAIYSINTTDAANVSGGCPCFGDYDQVGVDRFGFYIATNEFSVNQPNFNGAVIYAISKSEIIRNAAGTYHGTIGVAVYHMGTTDPFGSYHLSPSTVTQGSSAPGTEYFVESNGNLPYGPPNPPASGRGLEVFALLHTWRLDANKAPMMVEAPLKSEPYTQPPNAVQKAGSTYIGHPEGKLQTDFNAVQEVTYARGKLYGEFSTGFTHHGFRSGVAWFVIKPRVRGHSLKVRMAGQGYVKTNQELLYPVIGVNASGKGYLAMAVSGSRYYPSAAYMKFNGTKGPHGNIKIAARAHRPLDDFTCYPPFSTGQCRYGDYSMAQAFDGRIYMATEYVSQLPGDNLSNWSTRVWSARS